MHAASVHPEPGSNSRYNCIKTCLQARSNLSSLICSFYFCLSSILFQNCEILYFHTLCFRILALYFSLCCSIFNDRTHREAVSSANILRIFVRSPVRSDVFRFASSANAHAFARFPFGTLACDRRPSDGQLDYYITTPLFCQHFF